MHAKQPMSEKPPCIRHDPRSDSMRNLVWDSWDLCLQLARRDVHSFTPRSSDGAGVLKCERARRPWAVDLTESDLIQQAYVTTWPCSSELQQDDVTLCMLHDLFSDRRGRGGLGLRWVKTYAGTQRPEPAGSNK